ncbi:hypothetical protein TRAPUB_13471, partial [Trametes pubescens]
MTSFTPAASLSAIDDIKTAIGELQLRLDLEAQSLMRQYGFDVDWNEWSMEVPFVIKTLSSAYRTQLKAGITDSARRIHMKGGLIDISARIVESGQRYAALESAYNEFKTMYDTRSSGLLPDDKPIFAEKLETFTRAMDLFRKDLTSARQILQQNEAVFQWLDRPTAQLLLPLRRLRFGTPYKELPAILAQLIADLLRFRSERRELEDRSAALDDEYRKATHSCSMSDHSLAQHTRQWKDICHALERQATLQEDVLARVKGLLDFTSPPATLPDRHGSAFFALDLRDAHIQYQAARDSVGFIHE